MVACIIPFDMSEVRGNNFNHGWMVLWYFKELPILGIWKIISKKELPDPVISKPSKNHWFFVSFWTSLIFSWVRAWGVGLSNLVSTGVWSRIKEQPNTDLNPQWRAKKSGLPQNVHKRLGSWNYKCLWIPMGLALPFYHSGTTYRTVFMAMGAPTGGSQYHFELQRQLSYVQGF